MGEENGVDPDLHALKEQVLKLNMFNRAYLPSRIIGVERTAEIVDWFVKLMAASNGRLVLVAVLAKVAFISWKVAKGIIDGYHSGKG